MTNKLQRSSKLLFATSLLLSSTAYAQFDSGSTGEDGAFSPLVDRTVQLPEDGILNYTTVNIPAGVTIRYDRNATNTPVVILASGDVTIDGEINVSGGDAANAGSNGDGNLGDDGIPGLGGPGGFDGGSGGTVSAPAGGNGLGPGGGFGGLRVSTRASTGCPGTGAGFSGDGGIETQDACNGAPGGQNYGNEALQPLIGGSGGGGGHAGVTFGGAGGSGGGGAILIVSSQTISINGRLLANGGRPGDAGGAASGGVGGAGSGGAIRLVATTIEGNGLIQAVDGPLQTSDANQWLVSGAGSDGRIRFEAENFTRTAATTPAFTLSGPQPVFLANIPGVRINSVAGIVSPASPTGAGDIIIPEATPNPVAISFTTTNVPVGNTIELTLIPQAGASTNVISTAITGTEASGTANVSIDIPDGPSTLSASVTFTLAVAANGEPTQDYSQFAQGNTVEKVRIDFDPVQGSLTTFIADNGQEFTWPSNAVAFN